MTLLEDAAAVSGEITALRHAIHREPEIGFNLPRTQEKVLAALDGLPLEITLGRQLSSVTAVLRGKRPGPVVLLRGDMDALPVTEATGLPYASQVDGAMHACGHDLHTAMLAGAARLLSARQAELPGSVIFMFQPAEEGGGGAKIMIVTVRGRGGHASAPHRSADPIPAACEMVTALQAMVTRRFDAFDPVVLTVGAFHAGTRGNVIPEEATFQASVRSFSPQTRARLREETLRLVRSIAEAHGLSAFAEFPGGYPLTVNDPAEAGLRDHPPLLRREWPHRPAPGYPRAPPPPPRWPLTPDSAHGP